MLPLFGKGKSDVDMLLGDPKAAIRKMFVPIFLALLVVEINVFADNIWCSSLGVNSVSAISVVMTLYYFFSHTAIGLGVGVNVAVSNCIGAGDKEGAEQRCVQLLMLLTIITVSLIPFLFIFMDTLITFIGGDNIRGLCRDYLTPMFLMTPFIVMSGIFSGMLRGEGAAGKSSILNIVTAATNIILDPVFIFGFGMGVAGASLATGLSCVAAVTVGLWFYMSKRTYLGLSFRHFRFDKEKLADVLHVGVPQMLEHHVDSLVNLCLVLVIMGCGGALGLTLYNIPWKVVHMLMVPIGAVSAAMIPVISSARGQRDPERMLTACKYTLRISVAAGLAVTAIVLVAAEPIMCLFSYSGDMVEQRGELVRVMWIYAPFVIWYGMMQFSTSLLSAIRRGGVAAILTFIRSSMLLAFVFVGGMYGMDGVYWGVTLSETVGGAMTLYFALRLFRRYRMILERPVTDSPVSA